MTPVVLTKYSEMIENALDSFLKADTNSPYIKLIDAMRYSLMNSGKRVRPALVMEFCRICCGQPEKAISFACALEMIHTYSLIHDDLPCMDNDDMRRGKPSCHIAHGEDIALLAGDGLLTLAFETAATADVPTQSTVRAIKEMAHYAGYKGMIGGQVLDLSLTHESGKEDVLLMITGKTCALFEAACVLGCIAGGADEDKIQLAREYAVNMGMTFQIVDDILDLTGDTAILGKKTGSDVANDKINFVSVYGLEKARELAIEYNQKAMEKLAQFGGDTSHLEELTAYLLDRNK